MASLLDLARHGQSVWLDFIDRNLVARGGLERLVDSGVTGVTTNPSIFNKAIGAGPDYDEAIREQLERNHEIGPAQLCEALMVADVQAAADVLRPVYERTREAFGQDRYLLTNPDVDPTTMGAVVVTAVINKAPVFFRIDGTASASVGPGGNRGHTAIENDQSMLGELFTNPNAST